MNITNFDIQIINNYIHFIYPSIGIDYCGYKKSIEITELKDFQPRKKPIILKNDINIAKEFDIRIDIMDPYRIYLLKVYLRAGEAKSTLEWLISVYEIETGNNVYKSNIFTSDNDKLGPFYFSNKREITYICQHTPTKVFF